VCVLSEPKLAAPSSPSGASVPQEQGVNLGKVARGVKEGERSLSLEDV